MELQNLNHSESDSDSIISHRENGGANSVDVRVVNGHVEPAVAIAAENGAFIGRPRVVPVPLPQMGAEEAVLHEALKQLAISARNEASSPPKVCSLWTLDHISTSVLLLLEICASIGLLLQGKQVWEFWWTIGQHFVTSLFIYTVATYSGKDRPWYKTIGMILSGVYNFEWLNRKACNDSKHVAAVEQLIVDDPIKVDMREEGTLQQKIVEVQRVRRFGVVGLKVNAYISVKLAFVGAMVGAFPMAIFKIYQERLALVEDVQLCALQILFRAMVVTWAVIKTARMIAKDEVRGLEFVKTQNIFTQLDEGDGGGGARLQPRTKFPKLVYWATVLFHTIGIFYRGVMVAWYLEQNLINGLLHLIVILPLLSLAEYHLFRPRYQNVPIGAPTTSYALLEGFAGMFTFRNSRFSSADDGWSQLKRTIVFVALRLIGHLVPFLLLLVPAVAPKFGALPAANATQCNSTFYVALSAGFELFSFSVNVTSSSSNSTRFVDIAESNWPQFGLLAAHLIYSIAWFAYLHFAKLNNDHFPHHVGAHLWEKKFLPKKRIVRVPREQPPEQVVNGVAPGAGAPAQPANNGAPGGGGPEQAAADGVALLAEALDQEGENGAPAAAAVPQFREEIQWEYPKSIDWYFRMMMCTVSKLSMKKIRKLPPLQAMQHKQLGKITDSDLTNIQDHATIEQLTAALNQLDAPLLGELVSLARHMYANTEGLTDRQRLVARGITFKFCTEFLPSMRALNSLKIAQVCDALGESPIVPSDYVEDPLLDWIPDLRDRWVARLEELMGFCGGRIQPPAAANP